MAEQSGEFAGLAALVTGGASGIGLATARLLAARGARVALLDRVKGDGESTDLYPVIADVTDDAAVRAAVAEAGRALGRLDIVVNNAGIGAAGTVEDNDDAEWHRVLDVNVLGIVRTTRAALPLLRQAARERGQAAIVNTCSIAAIAGLPQRALYSATKGAVYSLTLAMAADHVAEGIRVNCVTPGTADTPWVGRLLDAAPDPAAERAALNARQPMGRLVSADEVAAAIAYLASPLAGATTGTALAVDGGMQGLRIRPRPARVIGGESERRMTKITGFDTFDIRFPTSRTLAGSDAMNPAPDYSAAYVVIRTDAADPALSGHGFAFTIGRGNDVQLAAIRLLEPFLAGQDLDEVLADLGGLGRRLVSDSPLHWLGPSCGVMHMATGAVLNACWDLAARRAAKPLWLLLAEMSPEEIIALVDFRYLSEALTPDEALALLERGAAGRDERIAALHRDGYPAYSTGPGWLGYSDERLAALCEEAVAEGFGQVKIKVGAALADDKRRCAIARSAVGEDVGIAIDANQVWDVPTAIAWISELAPFRPAWVEEPTAPEDILGTAAIRRAVRPVPVATGEHVANPVMFKQLLQAGAIDIMQIDACRVAGVNENIANLLLAAKFGVPVCPHAGGVGLCEIVQHLSMFDFAALSGTTQGRRLEWIDHLHEHFAAPAVVTGGRYRAPRAPGRPPRSCRSRWRSTATRPARRGAAAGCRDHGPGPFGRPPRLRRGAHRRALRAGQRRGGGRDAGRGLGRGDPGLRHRAALRRRRVRAADRRVPGRAPAGRVHRVHQGRPAAGARHRGRPGR